MSTPARDQDAAVLDQAARRGGHGEQQPREEATTPLASLTSLLGGSIESGATCAADGSCD